MFSLFLFSKKFSFNWWIWFLQFDYCNWKIPLRFSCSERIGQIHAVFCSYWDSIAVPFQQLVPIPVINLKGMVRSEGKCSYRTINFLNSSCTENTVTVLYCTQKCCCSLLKPKQRTDIFSVLTLNSIQCFSCFQLQFTHCPLISVKPGELLKVPHKSLRKSMLFAVKYGLLCAM